VRQLGPDVATEVHGDGSANGQRRTVKPGITFRVFVSSTFQDFAAERNALEKRVWPAMRDPGDATPISPGPISGGRTHRDT